jgi:hypothetical protein
MQNDKIKKKKDHKKSREKYLSQIGLTQLIN